MDPNRTTTSLDYTLLGNQICTILFSIIYCLALIGNSFTLLTFSSVRMRQISSSIYLLVLAISDTLALVTSVWFFLSDAFSISLQNYSALACRFRTFFAYVFLDLSSWCIAGLSFDRFLRTEFASRAKRLCTPQRAWATISVFFIILCGINGHYLSGAIGQERSGNRTTAHCLENKELYPNYYRFYKIIWPKIDMIVFCFLPVCIMIVCNLRIIYILRRKREKMETHHDDLAVNVPINRENSNKTRPLSTRKSIERQMSLMMFACVLVFILTTMPGTIYLIFLEQFIVNNRRPNADLALHAFIFRLLRALFYIHCASNFYLHCLTSRIFRAEFLQAIRCRRSKS